MKKIVFAVLLCCSLSAFAQEEVVYKYIIAEPQGRLFSDKCKLRIDDGISPSKAKGDKDKSITFKSFAAALMYLTSQGWELVSNYNTVSGAAANGYGSTSTSTYWILRRPSTKEEVQDIIDKSIKKENEE